MAKAAEAFRTISEVAQDLGIQKHVLRFWEVKFSQIRPMKRGGGRRYYRPEDMELLRGIRQLLHRDGYTIKGVQKILREQGVEAVKSRIRQDDADAAPSPPAASSAASERPLPDLQAVERKAGALMKGRRRPGGIDRSAVISAVIAELSRCRQLLESELGAGPAVAVKAERKRRRAG